MLDKREQRLAKASDEETHRGHTEEESQGATFLVLRQDACKFCRNESDLHDRNR